MDAMLPGSPADDKALTAANPILAEVWRGEGVESVHRGAACIVDLKGAVAASWGSVETPVFPRSAIKPFQAMGVVESGAADFFRLTEAELALACASHTGHGAAFETARDWLDGLELPETALICGAQEPVDLKAAAQLIRDDASPTRLHNNCSGKHLAMLTTCLHRGLPIEGYAAADHPVQQAWMTALEEMAGESLTAGPRGVDGCGLAAVSLSLRGLARAAAAFCGKKRQKTTTRLRAAMTARPDLVAGPGRFDTETMQALPGVIIVKSGAEGVRLGVLPRRGLGFAVKIDDGAERACESVSAALIARALGRTDPRAATFTAQARRPILNAVGETVGAVRPAATLEGGRL